MKRNRLPILYEDDQIIAVNKPPRVATVPSADIPLIETVLGKVQQLFESRGIKPFVLHRLDFQTSGVLLLGKHEKDRAELETIFKHPKAKKTYVALVRGIPTGHIITKPLRARTSDVMISAQTKYKVIKSFGHPSPKCALVEAEIATGRKHQIRQHFSMIGHPIIMDSKYGDPHFNRKFRIRMRLGRHFLHAWKLQFWSPFLKKLIHVEAPLTMDLQSVIKKLDFAR